MSVRDQRRGVIKTRRKVPDFVRKAGPHQPLRIERRSSKRDAVRRAVEEALT